RGQPATAHTPTPRLGRARRRPWSLRRLVEAAVCCAPAPHESPTRGTTRMSGPNTQYDPVEVAVLDPAALDAAVREATAAFPAAGTRDGLKAARIPHVDRGAVALARREIGALPPSAKADAGRRVGAAQA